MNCNIESIPDLSFLPNLFTVASDFDQWNEIKNKFRKRELHHL